MTIDTRDPADQWGLVSFPSAATPEGEGKGDPAIWIYLNFLRAYLQVDGNVTGLWDSQGLAPGRLVVNAIRAHNPNDKEASAFAGALALKDLPALYMWSKEAPDAASYEAIAEDWLVQTREWHLLWVAPRASGAQTRVRASFDDALAKAIVNAIERGRTPGFVVDGDPDPTAKTRGSFVHTFTSVFSIWTTHSGAARVEVGAVGATPPGAATTFVLPALEMRFEYKENLTQDPRIWSAPSRLHLSAQSGQPAAQDWEPLGAFALGSSCVATPPGMTALYLYTVTAVVGGGQAGASGGAAPTWPAVLGATVQDGDGLTALTWTCQGLAPAPPPLVGNG